MPKLPVVRPKEMVKFLQKRQFAIRKTKSGHIVMIHPDGRRTTVPIHNKTLAKGTLHGIFKQTKISPEEFNK